MALSLPTQWFASSLNSSGVATFREVFGLFEAAIFFFVRGGEFVIYMIATVVKQGCQPGAIQYTARQQRALCRMDHRPKVGRAKPPWALTLISLDE